MEWNAGQPVSRGFIVRYGRNGVEWKRCDAIASVLLEGFILYVDVLGGVVLSCAVIIRL